MYMFIEVCFKIDSSSAQATISKKDFTVFDCF